MAVQPDLYPLLANGPADDFYRDPFGFAVNYLGNDLGNIVPVRQIGFYGSRCRRGSGGISFYN